MLGLGGFCRGRKHFEKQGPPPTQERHSHPQLFIQERLGPSNDHVAGKKSISVSRWVCWFEEIAPSLNYGKPSVTDEE